MQRHSPRRRPWRRMIRVGEVRVGTAHAASEITLMRMATERYCLNGVGRKPHHVLVPEGPAKRIAR